MYYWEDTHIWKYITVQLTLEVSEDLLPFHQGQQCTERKIKQAKQYGHFGERDNSVNKESFKHSFQTHSLCNCNHFYWIVVLSLPFPE